MHEALSKELFAHGVRGITPRLTALRSWTVNVMEYPVLDVSFMQHGRKTLRVRMHCDSWNELPPAVELLEQDGTALVSVPQGPTGVFNGSAHPITGKPFICMIGSREYHTHSSHTADLWDNYKDKSGYDLGDILGQIHSAWLKSQP